MRNSFFYLLLLTDLIAAPFITADAAERQLTTPECQEIGISDLAKRGVHLKDVQESEVLDPNRRLGIQDADAFAEAAFTYGSKLDNGGGTPLLDPKGRSVSFDESFWVEAVAFIDPNGRPRGEVFFQTFVAGKCNARFHGKWANWRGGSFRQLTSY